MSVDIEDLFTGLRPPEYDLATVRELLDAKWVSMFSAKLYITTPIGCLRIDEEFELHGIN